MISGWANSVAAIAKLSTRNILQKKIYILVAFFLQENHYPDFKLYGKKKLLWANSETLNFLPHEAESKGEGAQHITSKIFV